MVHEARIIRLDHRSHLPSNIRQWLGDSLGHWEGATLVVDTTNFNDRTAFSREIPYFTDALHTTERFTPVAPDVIAYEITIDDSTQFTRPWKVAGYFTRVAPTTESFEYAFYFPAPGNFAHFPVHVAKNEQLIASAHAAGRPAAERTTLYEIRRLHELPIAA